ncbi:MAG TPA: FecR family protein, partial [Burkholderiales bacterium]
MSRAIPFRLNRSGLLLALISAGFAGEVGAAAARVDFAAGGVTVTGQDGRARALAKGTELDRGDTVRTTTDGRAQLRFSDGSYVSLQPNTDFAISEYKYEGKDDDRGFFGLVRGAMRTVTGAVGRVNRNSYRITTPTATVGIRGTGGVIQVLNDGSTLVIGTSGIWSLTNPSGSIDIPAGVSGLAPRETNAPPRETNTQPQARPADVPPPKPIDYKKGEDVNAEGQP